MMSSSRYPQENDMHLSYRKKQAALRSSMSSALRVVADTRQETHREINDYLKSVRLFTQGADSNGNTPLHFAAYNNNAQLVGLLLSQQGANVDAVNKHGWTPLYTAAKYGKAEVVRALLQKGADATLSSNGGHTPLQTALRKDSCDDCVNLLLAAGAVNKYVFGVTECRNGRVSLWGRIIGVARNNKGHICWVVFSNGSERLIRKDRFQQTWFAVSEDAKANPKAIFDGLFDKDGSTKPLHKPTKPLHKPTKSAASLNKF